MGSKIIPIVLLLFFIFFAIKVSIEAGEINEVKAASASSEFNVSSNYNLKNLNELKNSKIYWNNKTGALHRIFGKEIKIEGFKEIREAKEIKEKGKKYIEKDKKDIEKDRKDIEKDILKIINNFIENNENFLKVKRKELKLISFDSDNVNYYINYQQHYKGIPVHQSFVGLTIDGEGRILLMGSDFHPEIDVSTTPAISKGDALNIAKKEVSFVNFNYDCNEVRSISLIIFPIEEAEEYHLAWKINVFTENPLRDWIIFIDAFNGEIIHKYDAIKSGSINGTITGMIYPERYDQEQIKVNFSYEKVYTNITSQSLVFYSGFGGEEGFFYDSSMTTINPINLSNANYVNLNFSVDYDIEPGWDFAYVEVSNDSGVIWHQLNSTYMTTYHHPLVYAEGWVNGSPAYTGDSNGVIHEAINLTEYAGENILLRFRYTTDKILFKEGFYVDDILINTNNGVVFFDDGKNNSNKWNLSGFNITNASFGITNTISNEYGYYEIDDVYGSINMHSELKGLWVDVDNDDLPDAEYNYNLSVNETHDWNWNESDLSYKKVESNAYYHVNKIHDYFKIFNFTGFDYPLKTIVGYGTDHCNAYYDSGADRIMFGDGDSGCENLALSSDAIYHEYTHGVVDHTYDLEGSDMEDAMHEAFSDYFAATINNDSIVMDGWYFNRSLDNDRKYPDDWSSDEHIAGLILGGALWDLREEFGSDFADALIFEAIRITPHAYNFSEFLENLLVADDDNANLWDGTPDKIKICDVFYERKIYSFWCSDLRPDLIVENITYLPENPKTTSIVNLTASIKNSGVNLNLSSVNISLFIDNIYENSEILNLTNITKKEVNFSWTAIASKHNISVIVDPNNEINETDETNNELAVNLSIYHECDLNHDGIIISDYNDLIFAYKCFLGIEKNCEINYMDWINMKKEYQCFLGN